MKRPQKETWRERYIRLLESRPEARTDLSEEDRQDWEVIGELIEAGYLRGNVRKTHSGGIYGHLEGPTLEGRLFAEEQRQLVARNSLWGRIKSGAGLFVGWLAGVGSSLLVYYLTK